MLWSAGSLGAAAVRRDEGRLGGSADGDCLCGRAGLSAGPRDADGSAAAAPRDGTTHTRMRPQPPAAQRRQGRKPPWLSSPAAAAQFIRLLRG